MPEGIRGKLRSADKACGPEPKQQTPKYLRVIVSPDDVKKID